MTQGTGEARLERKTRLLTQGIHSQELITRPTLGSLDQEDAEQGSSALCWLNVLPALSQSKTIPLAEAVPQNYRLQGGWCPVCMRV